MTLAQIPKRQLPEPVNYTGIPTYHIGPLLINGSYAVGLIEKIPLATLESTLIPSTQRGLKVIKESNGVNVYSEDRGMTRSPYLMFKNLEKARIFCNYVEENKDILRQAGNSTTNHGKIKNIETYLAGDTVHMRVTMFTGDASGHNMVAKASEKIVDYVIKKDLGILDYCISGNTCIDKKVSAINNLFGRGRKVDAEIVISRDIVKEILKTTPEKIMEVYIRKDLEGSIIAGSIASANAHHANLISALYIATGQDIANVVEGSQGMTRVRITKDGSLYFGITSPNLIIGTLGNGKEKGEQRKNLELLNCYGSVDDKPGYNTNKLAEIFGAVILSGELSLTAALTNPNELVEAHTRYERKK